MNTGFAFFTPRQGSRRFLRWGLEGAVVLLLAACANTSGDLAKAEASHMAAEEAKEAKAAQARQLQRENQLQSAWKGRPYDALLENFGAPILTMNVLGYRPLKTSLVVYGMLDQNSNCIDAFTMVKDEQSGQWSVADYFCR